ncbi:hypothetical protein QNM99_15825 [Pseudomonas sp. PCH446]
MRTSACEPASEAFDKQALLHAFHPDYRLSQYAAAGGRQSRRPMPRELTDRLHSNAQIDDAALAGARWSIPLC